MFQYCSKCPCCVWALPMQAFFLLHFQTLFIEVLLAYNITHFIHITLFLLLYKLQHAHHQKYSFHLSPYTWFMYPFCPRLWPPLFWQSLLYYLVLHVSFCLVWFIHLFCLFLFSHKSVILSSFVWLISFSEIPSRFIHVVANVKISSF